MFSRQDHQEYIVIIQCIMKRLPFLNTEKKIDMLFLFNVEFFKISQNIC